MIFEIFSLPTIVELIFFDMKNQKSENQKDWQKPTLKELNISEAAQGSATGVPERFTGYPAGTPFGGS